MRGDEVLHGRRVCGGEMGRAELEDGDEADVCAVEGEEEDGEDLAHADVEEEVCLVVGWGARKKGGVSFEGFWGN